MVAMEEWLSISVASIPNSPPVGGVWLRCYYCSVCGYAELYHPKSGPEATGG